MAKLDRKDVKIFAENSDATLITEFRTEDASGETASFSRDPDVIQNENYSQGWVDNNPSLNTKIYGEDLNAVNYVLSYLLKYLYENGIAEWNSTTTYYENSIVKSGSDLYISLEDDNTGNDPTSTVNYWKLIPTDTITTQDAGIGYSIVKALSGNEITFKTLSVSGYGTITDNGDQLNINIAGGGGGGGGDAYWGMIQGTLSNQTDLVNALNAKQNTITCSSPLTLDSNNDISIPKATTSVSGYLDSTDWNTFNGKQNSLSFSTPLSETSGTVSISKADTSTSGYLDYNDWNTFNEKQNAIQDVSFTSNTTQVFQEPNTSKTSFMGTDFRPYNYGYFDQIGDSLTPVTNTYSTNLTSTNITTTNITTTNITTDNYKNNINYTNLQTTFTNFNFGSTYYYYQGTNHEMAILSITSSYDSDTNTVTDILPQKPNASKNHYCNLGSSNQQFTDGYFKRLTTSTSINTPEIIGGQSDGTVKVQDIRLGTIRGYTPGADIEINAKLKPGTNNQQSVGTNDNKFQAMYSYAYNGASDVRNKENVIDYKESVLDKLDKITPFTFNYKDDEKKTTRLGISAQELQAQEPLCVNGGNTKDSDEPLSIDLMQLIVFNMKAIKELNEKVKTLEARIEELEGNKEGEFKK